MFIRRKSHKLENKIEELESLLRVARADSANLRKVSNKQRQQLDAIREVLGSDIIISLGRAGGVGGSSPINIRGFGSSLSRGGGAT